MSMKFARAMRSRRRVDRAVRWTIEPLESRLLLSAVSWTGGGDGVNWTDPNNWSTHALPGATDDVTIGSGFSGIQVASGSQGVHSVTTTSPLTLLGGTLAVATTLQVGATLTLDGGNLAGATVTAAGGAQFTASQGTLNGVTLETNLTVNTGNQVLWVSNGLTLDNASVSLVSYGNATNLDFSGSQTLGGTGQVVFAGPEPGNFVQAVGGNSPATAATLTLGPGITVTESGAGGSIGGLYSQDSFVNQGTVDVQSGDTVNFGGGGTFTQADMGSIDNVGGTIGISGTLFGNLALDGSTGNCNLAGGTILNGTVTASGGAQFTASQGTLNGVTLETNLTVNTGNQVLWVSNGLTLDNASVSLVSNIASATSLDFGGSQTLGGTGRVVFAGSAPDSFVQAVGGNSPATAATLTLGPGITVTESGAGGSIGGYYSQDSFVNEGTISANQAGATINVADTGTLTNVGTLSATNGGTLSLNGALTESSTSVLYEPSSGHINFGGNVAASNTGAASFQPLGTVTLSGSGTTSTPQQLEVMSQDLGNVAGGYTDNFAYGSLSINNNDYVKLVDLAHNSSGTASEALYVNSLMIGSGATLNLNGLHVYARDTQNSGTINNGTLSQIPVGGDLPLDTPIPAELSTAGELDQWSFYDYGGKAVTIAVNPGTSGTPGTPAALSPQLQWANVQLLDANNNVLATASDGSAGAIVTLNNIVLPADGSYKININAPAGQTASTGNYNVSVYDVTQNVQPLAFNQPQTGTINTPYALDQWTFAASAGQQIKFNLIGTSNAGLAFSLTGPGGYSAFTNATSSSGLINLPTSGTYTLSVDGSNGATGNYSFSIAQTTQTTLPVGTPYSGTFAGSGQAEIFAISVTAAQPLSVVLSDTASGDHADLFASFGTLPTLAQFDYGSTAAGGSKSLLIPDANVGTWYVVVYAESVGSAPSAFTISAQSAEAVLTGSTPGMGASNASTTLTITGAGFLAGSAVSLVSGGTSYPATTSTVDLPTQMTATFAAGSVPAGTYAVKVTQADGSSSQLPVALTMVPSGQSSLVTHVELPNPMGRHIAETLYVDYTNTGTVAMPAPLLVLTATNAAGQQGALLTLDPSLEGIGLWTSATPAGFSQSVQILASGATPGVLQPGESERVPVYYAGWLDTQWNATGSLNFSIRIIQSNDSTAVNWPAMAASLQPAGMNAAAWATVFSALQSQMGSTSGGYIQLLDDEASYLGQLGEDVTDVATLWQFAVDQANSIRPMPSLGATTDDSLATPGAITLSFGRSWGEPISSRDTMGLLGMGWSVPWLQSVQVQPGGTVIYNDGQGMAYYYEPDSRYAGAYLSEPGDTNTLSADGSSGYLLTDAIGNQTDFTSTGQLNYQQDTNGNRIKAGYINGQLTSLTASSGQYIDLAYNAAGLISLLTDSSGRTTAYGYDPSNTYLVSVTSFDNQTIYYTYNTAAGSAAQNALTSITFPGNTHEYFRYDSEGRLAGTYSDGNSSPETFSYSLGEVSVTDGTGDTSSTYYNEDDLPSKVVDALGDPTYYSYDASFNLTKVVNALNQSETYTYNSVGEVTSSTDFLGNTTHFSYGGPFHALTSMTDANGNTTGYGYDASGDLLNTAYADGTGSSSSFNPLGEATSFINANGQPIDYTYNSAGQVLTESFSDGSQYAYTYDTHGSLLTATDETGTTRFTYDPTSELMTEVSYPNGTYLKFSYNAAGQRTQMVDQTGFTTNYIYDSAGRLSGLTDGSNNPIVTYTYDVNGRLAKKVNGNGTYTTYGYDGNGNVLQLTNFAPGGSVNSTFAYTYNALGLETTEITIDGKWTYGYDADGQLTSAVFAPNSTNPDGLAAQSLTYNYDAMGNRTSTVINGVTTAYAVNNMNQYTSVGGVPYTYDKDGNLLSDGVNTYTYNSLNELVGARNAVGTTSYGYDALGERISATTGGVITAYLVDPGGLTNLVGTYDAAGTAISTYRYGLGLVSETLHSSSATYFYDFDVIGNTVGLSNGAGSYVSSYSYAPFGSDVAHLISIPNPYEFAGALGLSIDSSGLTFARARSYSAALGRFLSEDPAALAGGQIDLYTYVGNNPVNRTDPTGEFADPLFPPPLPGCFSNEAQRTQSEINAQQVAAGYADAAAAAAVAGTALLLNPLTAPWAAGLFAASLLFTHLSGAWSSFATALAGVPICTPLPPGQPPGPPGGHGGGGGSTTTVGSQDPNAMFGPAGFGSLNYVAPISGELFPYQIDFENSPTSTSPAQEVTVTEQLDPNLDWSTFQLTGIGFGDTFITIPAGEQQHQTVVSMSYLGHSFNVEIQAGLRSATGQVYAIFQSLDPNTGLPPSNPLIGFLPPEDGTGRGTGYLSYSVSPKANLPTGTAITAIAAVSFDQGLSIATDQVNDEDPTQGISTAKQALVTIDSGAPTSTVAALPGNESSATFIVGWSGQDDAGGSGIAGYSVYVADNGGAYQPLVVDTTSTSASFTGQTGHTYSFYSVATDNVGNVQPTPSSAQATTTINVQVPVVASISPASGPFGGGTTVIINGSGFSGATAVDFGSTPASSFTVNSSGTQIIAIDPAGSGTVDVTVVTASGTSATSWADQFTYAPNWLAAGSAATWDATAHTLTVTGAATIIADPGTDEPNIVASGSASQLAITPATSPTDVHVGNITLSGGAGISMTSVSGRTHSNHNVLVIGPAGAANDPTVSIDSSSKLDLGSNDLIVHTGTSDSTGASELTAFRALAQTGRGVPAGSVLDGTWTGNGLTSSAAAAVDKAAGYEQNVLAVVRNNDQLLGTDTKWTVGSASESVGAKDIIVKYTYNGDAALEGYVGDDSVTIVNGFYDGGKSTQPDWAFGDFTGVGQVNDDDITILNGLYGNGTVASGLPRL